MELKLLLQIVGFSLGMLYLWLEYRASIYLWLVGMVMPVVHGALYFHTGLYADFSMNVYYFLAGIYGWLAWRNAPKKAGGGRISHVPGCRWPVIVAAYAAAHALIYWMLVSLTDSSVPFWDSLTTALSIVGMWMLARKYLEQWFVWLVVNAVTVGLYFFKGIPLTAVLYTVYLAMSLAGYVRWRRMMQASEGV